MTYSFIYKLESLASVSFVRISRIKYGIRSCSSNWYQSDSNKLTECTPKCSNSRSLFANTLPNCVMFLAVSLFANKLMATLLKKSN